MDAACDESTSFSPRFNEAGLLTCVVVDAVTRDVLMVAFMNDQALQETLSSGRAVYYSRSRKKLWRKGEESGNWQQVTEIRVDCDQDCLQILVNQVGGAACHTGRRSCFYRRLANTLASSPDLEFVDQTRVFDPQLVYGKTTA